MDLAGFVHPDNSVWMVDNAWPALLTRPGGSTIEPVRVIVLEHPDGSFWLAAWEGSAGGTITFLDQLITYDKNYKTGTLPDGQTVSYQRAHKCGCGSMLAGFRPWGDSVRQVAVAYEPQPA